MKTKDLIHLGVPDGGEAMQLAHEFIHEFIAAGNAGAAVGDNIFQIVADPGAFFSDDSRAPLARALYRPAFTPRAELAPWRHWGTDLEAEAVKQMANACALPVAVAGALMPDAQVCDVYSRRAMARRSNLPKELKHLAWLTLDEAED